MLLNNIAADYLFTANCQSLQYSFSQVNFSISKRTLKSANTLIPKIINSAFYFWQNKTYSMLFYYEDLNTISYNITLF